MCGICGLPSSLLSIIYRTSLPGSQSLVQLCRTRSMLFGFCLPLLCTVHSKALNPKLLLFCAPSQDKPSSFAPGDRGHRMKRPSWLAAVEQAEAPSNLPGNRRSHICIQAIFVQHTYTHTYIHTYSIHTYVHTYIHT